MREEKRREERKKGRAGGREGRERDALERIDPEGPPPCRRLPMEIQGRHITTLATMGPSGNSVSFYDAQDPFS